MKKSGRKTLLKIFGFCFTISILLGSGSLVTSAESVPENSISIDRFDPIQLERGEKLSDPEVDRDVIVTEIPESELENDIIVYTGRFYYMDSYKRDGAVEYAVKISGSDHIIEKKYEAITNEADRGNEIPVPGYLLSIPASKIVEYDYAVGEKIHLTNIEDMPIVRQTVNNLSKRIRVEIQNLNAATNLYAGSVYYGNDYGETTEQNSYNREVGFQLLTSGDNIGCFQVVGYRQFQTNNMQVWNQDGTVTTLAWNRNFTIPNPGFAMIAANVEDYEDDYVHAVFGMLNRDRAFSLGDIVSVSGKAFFTFEYEVTHYYDYLNPGSENEAGQGYPENRGAEQMMIYTKSVEDGSAELKTNQYGFEAAVNANGEIEKIAVNVVDIPKGGFVVSAQGLLRDWARTYFKKGATVIYDTQNKTFTIKNTLTTLKNETLIDLSNYENDLEVYRNGLYDLDVTVLESYFEEMKTAGQAMVEVIDYINENRNTLNEEERLLKQLELREKCNEFEKQKINIATASVESRIVEGRAVWHVPNVDGTETSLEGIRTVLDKFEALNLNMILLECYYAGYSHAISEYVPQNPWTKRYDYSGTEPDEQYGNDYFKAFFSEAKKRGFEVHISITACYMSRTDRWADEPDRLATVHPDWVNVSNTGKTATIDGHQAIFADPANTEYRKMLTSFVREMFTKYPELDGINLDFIRYPDKAAGGREFGYTKVSMKKFLKEYNYTFRGDDNENESELRTDFHNFVSSNSKIWAQWKAFRIQQINDMVAELRNAMKGVKSTGMVSIATGPSPNESREALYQDWSAWVKGGLIDFCTPMAYFTDSEVVEKIAEEEIEMINDIAYNYVGIGPYQKLSPSEWVKQIIATQSAGATGYSLFSSEQVLQEADAVELVAKTINKNKAILPHSETEEVLKVYFESILWKCENLYLPDGSMTQAQYDLLKAEFDAIQLMLDETAKELYAIYKRLETISQNTRKYVSFYAEKRLGDDVKLLMKNINIKINRMLIDNGEWNPLVSTARPILVEGVSNKIVVNNTNDGQIADSRSNDYGASFIIALIGVILANAGIIISVIFLAKSKKIKQGERE